jgi:hypothetical protein
MLPKSEAVLPLLRQNLLSGEGAVLTHHAVASARTVAVLASARLLQATTTHARGAVTGLYAACAQYTVTRRATLETGGLTVVLAYLPRVSVAGHTFDLGAPSPPTRIQCGSWAGVPRRAFCHGHVVGPAPLLPRRRHVAAPDPFPGGGGSGPLEAGRSSHACGGLAPTRGGPRPPWGVRVRGGHPRAPLPSWARGGPGPIRARSRSEDHDPSCQARAVCHVTQRTRRRLWTARR